MKNSELYAWYLVEAQLGRYIRSGWVSLQVRRRTCPNDIAEIILPILPSGRINELIKLPDDVTDLSWLELSAECSLPHSVHILKIGWFERNWRMVNRVFKTASRLSGKQRAGIGMSITRVFFDPVGAYRLTSQFMHSLSYAQWIVRSEHLDDEDFQKIRRHVESFAHPPHFYILLVIDGAEQRAAQVTLDSLKQQLFSNFTCTVLNVGVSAGAAFDTDRELKEVGLNSSVVTQPHVSARLDQLNETLAENREWVMVLRPGDVLPAHALFWFACESLARPNVDVFYSDDDVLDAEGQRCKPRFKPDFSLTHLRATNFVGDALVLRGSEVAAAGGVSLEDCQYGSYDLLLRVIDVAGDEGDISVAHIPAVLLHRGGVPNLGVETSTKMTLPHPNPPAEGGGEMYRERKIEHVVWNSSQWEGRALRSHLARNSVTGEVVETLPGCWRVSYPLPEVPPLVSIIVPTRDEPAIIRQCVESLLEKTSYPRFEILVVDNQSTDPEAQAYLAQFTGEKRIRVLHYDLPFNYSAINNFAARQARGEVLCLLNNDTEVISSDWLEEMVGQLLQPRVRVVGAKLYFPDGRVQHAGDTVGPGGCANHLHAFIERNEPGYCNRAAVAQELSAVTGACMLVWKSLYEELGGLNEKHLPVSFSDVDFCLRVREAGYRVVWTPHAELYHHESLSRGKDQTPDKKRRANREVSYMRKRWKHVMQHDPFYNPNLSYLRPDFSLSHFPAVEKPWKK